MDNSSAIVVLHEVAEQIYLFVLFNTLARASSHLQYECHHKLTTLRRKQVLLQRPPCLSGSRAVANLKRESKAPTFQV